MHDKSLAIPYKCLKWLLGRAKSAGNPLCCQAATRMAEDPRETGKADNHDGPPWVRVHALIRRQSRLPHLSFLQHVLRIHKYLGVRNNMSLVLPRHIPVARPSSLSACPLIRCWQAIDSIRRYVPHLEIIVSDDIDSCHRTQAYAARARGGSGSSHRMVTLPFTSTSMCAPPSKCGDGASHQPGRW